MIQFLRQAQRTDLRERLDLPPMTSGALSWKETQGSMTRGFVLHVVSFVNNWIISCDEFA